MIVSTINMKNTHLYIFLSCVLFLSPPTLASAQNKSEKPFTVVIDPGHGGQDPGAVYRQIREKDIVLKLGLKLASYIREDMPGTQIIFTRDKDIFIPLHQRAAIANENHADLFISIHANFCGSPSISGTETFVLGLHRSEENLEVAKKENAVILLEEDYSTSYEGFDPNSSESYIMFEMVQDEYLDQSISMAAMTQNQFKTRAARNDRGVKQAGFLVLRRTSMPSILIEAGFLSNPREAEYLSSTDGQTHLASAIFQALKEYKASVDSKSDYTLSVQKPATKTEHITGDAPSPSSVQQSNQRGLTFSVQLAVTKKRIEPSPANFKGLQNVFVREQNGQYKYFYGSESSYQEILKRKNEISKKYRDAFISAFKNEKPIPLKEALKQLN